MTARIALLASGSGTNVQALVDFFAGPGRTDGTIVWVGSNRADAGALGRAAAAGIATGVLSDFTNGDELVAMLRAAGVDLVVLAGYLKKVPPQAVSAFHGRMLNVHPSLLPAFGGHGMYGARVHEAVLQHGARLSGVTVHFVDDAFDRGPIVAQWPVAVHPDDTTQTLAARVLHIEHRLLPRAAAAVAAGRVTLDRDGRVRGEVSLPELSTLTA